MGSPETLPSPRPSTSSETIRPASKNEADQKAAPSVLEPTDGNMTDQTEAEKPVADEPPKDLLQGWKLFIVMAVMTLVMLLSLMDISIIVTAIPKITSDFQSLPDVGWYGGAYQLASACLQPLAGKLYTHLNSKVTFLTFFAFFLLGSLICGVANSSAVLIGGRAVAGAGVSGLMNGVMTIISSSVPLHKRPVYFGIALGCAQLGLIMGPLVGGALTEYATWRWCFYINLPLGGLVYAALLFIRLPEHVVKPKLTPEVVRRLLTKDLDLVGFAIFAPSTIMLLLALQFGGNEFAWASATVIGLFVGAAAVFGLFLLYEFYVAGEDGAMLPLGMIRMRAIWTGCLFATGLMSCVILASFFLPIYFQTVKGQSPLMSGVDLLPTILAQLLMAVVSGALVSKLGYYLPWCFFAAAVTAVGNGLISTFTPTTSTARWIGYLIIVGAGRGAGIQMPFLAAQVYLPPEQISVGMSVLVFAQNLGGALFITLANAVFYNSLRDGIANRLPFADSHIPPELVVGAGGSAEGIQALWNRLGPAVATDHAKEQVLLAYTDALARVFYVAVGAAVMCFVVAYGLGWKDMREKKKDDKGTAVV